MKPSKPACEMVSLTNPETVQLFTLIAVDDNTIKLYSVFIPQQVYYVLRRQIFYMYSKQ